MASVRDALELSSCLLLRHMLGVLPNFKCCLTVLVTRDSVFTSLLAKISGLLRVLAKGPLLNGLQGEKRALLVGVALFSAGRDIRLIRHPSLPVVTRKVVPDE